MSREKQIDLKGMRAYEELSDIPLPIEQEEMMDIICDAWEECQQSDCRVCTERPHRNMRIMACTALKYTRLLREAGYRKQEWISVDERLPTETENDRGLVGIVNGYNGKIHFRNAIVLVDYDFSEKEWWSEDYELTGCEVVYWMPLPEAPKMKGGAE